MSVTVSTFESSGWGHVVPSIPTQSGEVSQTSLEDVCDLLYSPNSVKNILGHLLEQRTAFDKVQSVVNYIWEERPSPSDYPAIALSCLNKYDNMMQLIAIARNWVNDAVADRLVELDSFDVEISDYYDALQLESVRSFISFCLHLKQADSPLLAATPDGLLEASWENEHGAMYIIRFMNDRDVWVSKTSVEGQVAIAEDQLENLFPGGDPMIPLPEWF